MFDTVNVFLIEDEQAIVDLVDATLKAKPESWAVKYNLKSVGTLADAKRYVGGGGWDIIILDLGLPDSQGIKTLDAVLDATKTPVIVFSAREDYDEMVRFRALGAARYYSKIQLSNCMFMLHYIIDNVVREARKNNRLEYLQAAMFDELRSLVSECSNCNLWKDPVTEEFISPKDFLVKFNIFITSGICPDCRDELYGHLGDSSDM